VLPELWSTGYALDQSRELANPLNVGVFAQMATLATQNKISVVGSSLEKRGLEVTNSSAFFAPNGRLMGVYRKVHLFRLMEEDRWLQPGEAPLIMDLPWGTTGMAICYDLRFPELFRRLVSEGAELIALPAAFTATTGRAHWEVLVRARAIEDQVFLIAAAQTGTHAGGRETHGDSMIVDPWGVVLARRPASPGVVLADLDLDMQRRVRRDFPVLTHRVLDT
jgi:predicted amidohydrolase